MSKEKNIPEIAKIIGMLKGHWERPREAIHRGQKCPFLLACAFADKPPETRALPTDLPDDVREFWLTTRRATLFKDEQYGQWGIEIFEPAQALSETSRQATARPRDFINSDLVIGRFFGDSDFVVLANDPQQSDFGSVTIALPIDKRTDWPIVANSFGNFLARLVEAQGDKYWEVRN